MHSSGCVTQEKSLLPRKLSGDVMLAKIGKANSEGKGMFNPGLFQVALLPRRKISLYQRNIWISRAILIATAFGVAGLATTAGTAHVIATNQAKKVLKKVQNHRAEDIQNSIINDKFVLGLIQDVGADLDGVRETTTLATHAQTNLNQAIAVENKFSHLVSRSGIVEFSDPCKLSRK